MTKKKVVKLLSEAACDLKIVNVYMIYNDGYYNLIPLKLSDKLFLAFNEDDFIFDGFRIFRFKDVKKVRIKNDKCDAIVRSEGLLNDIHIPDINLENWQAVFECLKKIGKNIIVKYETKEGKDDNLTIGKIDCIHKNCLFMYHFDADGVWEHEPYRIPFTEVTSVTLESRYVNIFTKYLSQAPTA